MVVCDFWAALFSLVKYVTDFAQLRTASEIALRLINKSNIVTKEVQTVTAAAYR